MWRACRSSRRLRINSPRPRFATPATARSGTVRRAGTVSRSWRAEKSRKKRGAACQAIRTTSTADTSRRWSTACASDASTCRTAIRRPGPKFDYKLRWFERLATYAATASQARCARRAGGRLQRHAHGAGCLQAGTLARRRAFPPRSPPSLSCADETRLDRRAALVSPGRRRSYTFWDYFRNAYARNAGLRIDHLLVSPSIAGRLTGADVDRDVRGWERASDHAPAWIELRDVRKHAKRAPRVRQR